MKYLIFLALIAVVACGRPDYIATDDHEVDDQTDDDEMVIEKAKTPPSLCSINMAALNAQIATIVDQKLAKQPVIGLAYIWFKAKREIFIAKMNGGTLLPGTTDTDQPSPIKEVITLKGKDAITGKILAYRAEYNDYHKSGLGAVFVNLEALFPCIKKAGVMPACHLTSQEEDGFAKGAPIVTAQDLGNDLKIFSTSSNIKTFGFVAQGCKELLNTEETCMPYYYEKNLVCYLPRSCAE
jgi:hypothetical protein